MMVHADIIYKLSFQLVAGCHSKNYKYIKKTMTYVSWIQGPGLIQTQTFVG